MLISETVSAPKSPESFLTELALEIWLLGSQFSRRLTQIWSTFFSDCHNLANSDYQFSIPSLIIMPNEESVETQKKNSDYFIKFQSASMDLKFIFSWAENLYCCYTTSKITDVGIENQDHIWEEEEHFKSLLWFVG